MFNIQKTTEYKAVEELSKMDILSSQALQTLIRNTKQAHSVFWGGTTSPQIKMQLLGTKAIQIFQAQEATENLIQALKPDYEKLGVPAEYEIVWNEDGSATVNLV